jgi:hypothetical protein
MESRLSYIHEMGMAWHHAPFLLSEVMYLGHPSNATDIWTRQPCHGDQKLSVFNYQKSIHQRFSDWIWTGGCIGINDFSLFSNLTSSPP